MPRPLPALGFIHRSFASVLIALLALLATSCSGSEANVRGQVLFRGQPIEGAVVTFHPKGGDSTAYRPSGLTDKEGRFTLSTGSKPGAAPGEYVVTINLHKPVEPPAGSKKAFSTDMQIETRDEFQGKPYALQSTSPLSAKIVSGSNELEPFRID